MSTPLREFLSRRDAEIKEQMKLLRAEQKEIQVARAALDAEGGDDAPYGALTGTPTIKEMAKDVLSGAQDGMTSSEILAAIKEKFGRTVDRTSLSPQLTRLKDNEKVLVLSGERWFTKSLYAAWEQRMSEGVNFNMLDDPSDAASQEAQDAYDEEQAANHDRVNWRDDAEPIF